MSIPVRGIAFVLRRLGDGGATGARRAARDGRVLAEPGGRCRGRRRRAGQQEAARRRAHAERLAGRLLLLLLLRGPVVRRRAGQTPFADAAASPGRRGSHERRRVPERAAARHSHGRGGHDRFLLAGRPETEEPDDTTREVIDFCLDLLRLAASGRLIAWRSTDQRRGRQSASPRPTRPATRPTYLFLCDGWRALASSCL